MIDTKRETIYRDIKMQKKGITLMPLVITIIVLLILAGIVISVTVGENGIMQNAKKAGEQTERSSVQEELQLAIFGIQIEMVSDFTMEGLVTKLTQNGSQYLSQAIEQLDENGQNGIYRGYGFHIEPETCEVVMDQKIERTK